ncbi:hypothetical protein AB0I94_39200 [Streptomyces sp. NPDC050147]|uniref:hypothetical protein n=1 Tax=Streptomyces sp. NPDC050147 TaxID=3155513 RepID=UPI00342163EA
MTGYGAGIRRGEMAGDRFTQIANALFRDKRISFKAKGIFGLISTHRDGWRITVAALARCGPDGRSAVGSGLEELETYGYLTRERERREDGTFGEVIYAITDAPAHLYDLLGDNAPTPPAIAQSRRSQPESVFPAQDFPALENRTPKNTKSKNTKKPNTNSVHPSVPDARTREIDAPNQQRGRAGQTRTQAPATATGPAPTAGQQLLLSLGAQHPDLLLTGQALTDQGYVVQDLLQAGWTPEQVRHVIADRPLPRPLHHTVGAIIAARLRTARATPAPGSTAPPTEPGPSAAAGRTVADAVFHRALVECGGCGSPGRAPGQDLCPACLNWPACTACTGPTPRRADPAGNGLCSVCAT